MLHRTRWGFQLLELTISLTTASMLLAGLTASIVVASRASELASERQNRSLRNSVALDRLRSDLAEAAPVLARSATSATLSIGDRNADDSPETIQYRWLGAGTPLQMSANAGAWQSLTTDLENFQFGWQTCQPQSTLPTPPPLEPARSLVFQSRTLASNTLPGRWQSIDVPSTYRTNDLLVLAAAVTGIRTGRSRLRLDGLRQVRKPTAQTVCRWRCFIHLLHPARRLPSAGARLPAAMPRWPTSVSMGARQRW